MVKRTWLSVMAVSVLYAGCHQTRQVPVGSLNATTAAHTHSFTTPEASVAPSSAAAPSAVTALSLGSSAPSSSEYPPKLKPVLAKPFPDGASDEQVCEAIANTAEKDLWLRFGHLVPLAVVGSILVIEASEADIKRIEGVVRGYRYPFWPSIKRCSSGKVLLYIRDLSDDIPGGEPYGPRHLASIIEADLGLKVTEAFGIVKDRERLSDYCRLDADLCEQLVKLDYDNQGKGLCSEALELCSGQSDPKYRKMDAQCRTLPRQQVACLEVLDGLERRDECEEQVRQTLCPGRSLKQGASP